MDTFANRMNINGTTSHNQTLPVTTPGKRKTPKRKTKTLPTKPKQPKPDAKSLADSCRLWMTVILGVGIPCLSLAMSKVAGTLAHDGRYALAAFAFGLMVSVLLVSLPHLAWSVSNITRSGRRASWSLAIALDLSLVLCELIHVYADTLGLTVVTLAVMGCVALASMALNVWAFLVHE